jgi:hypothetical protein
VDVVILVQDEAVQAQVPEGVQQPTQPNAAAAPEPAPTTAPTTQGAPATQPQF